MVIDVAVGEGAVITGGKVPSSIQTYQTFVKCECFQDFMCRMIFV